MEKQWVIYMHVNKINGKVYIGQTCQYPYNDRWRDGKGYKTGHFSYAIQKYGWNNFSHIILESNIKSREEANNLEKFWIRRMNSTNPKYGYNEHEGGTGFSSEQIKEISLKNWQNPEFRKKFCKPVICLNNQKVYESIEEASRRTNIGHKEIANCCKGINKTAGKNSKGEGLVWRFFDPDKDYIMPTFSELNNNRTKVICITTGEVFESMTLAGEKMHTSLSGISQCCSGQRKSAGKLEDGTKLTWAFYEKNKIYTKEKVLNTNSKKVILKNTGQIFNSIKEAGAFIKTSPSNISACCCGKRLSAGKINGEKAVWCFLESGDNEI